VKVVAISLGLVLLIGAGLWTAPRWLVPRIAARSPGCLYSVPTAQRTVALTFDDGPDRAHTREILDVLAANDTRATFFLISERVTGNEALVSAIVGEGHELGNHLTRDEPSIRLAPDAFEAAARDAGAVLARFAPVRWLRPGSGWYDAAMLATIERLGYRCALGSVYPYDPHIRSARVASAYILANVRPGAVIVLHEGGARGPRTVETLRRVLPVLRARGYGVVTLSEVDRLRTVKADP
jgi:peptidoglycan/xylan/chitin deacetylase (PgdA/CDA1 family)